MHKSALKVLLIKRDHPPFKGIWALPGGFLLKNESSANAAKRALREKAGVKNVYTEQLYTFDAPHRDPRGRVVTVTYFALVNKNKIRLNDEEHMKLESTKKLPILAFDHKNIVRYAIERLRYKLEYTNVVYSLLPEAFTLSDLQKVHEVILNRTLDKRNFRKKFLSLGLIAATKKKLSGGRQRPAKLYRFRTHKPTQLKRFF